eukprot:8534388-Karenia_brevis.AAC.1
MPGCPAALRVLKPRPGDEARLRAKFPTSPFSAWQSLQWHTEDHAHLFFNPARCLGFETMAALVQQERDVLHGA